MTIERDAERAVIGAILLEPARLHDVSEWLEPQDFGGTAERLVFESITDLEKDGVEVSPDVLNQRLLERTEHRHVPADAPFLVTCIQQCPSADRAAVYGRMVLETSIRRHISDAAAGLRQRAQLTEGPGHLTRVFAMVDTVRREVETLHQREATASGALAPTPVEAGGLLVPRRHEAADSRQLELTAVRALVENPATIGVIRAWLKVEDFRDSECAVHFNEVLTMNDSRVPIDRLTLAWALAQRGVSSKLAIGEEHLPTGADPIAAGRRVLEQSVRSTVVDTAIAVEEGMSRHEGFPATAIAYRRLNGLWPEQRRLVAASRSESNGRST